MREYRNKNDCIESGENGGIAKGKESVAIGIQNRAELGDSVS